MGSNVTIVGLKELGDALDNLGIRGQRDGIRAAIKPAAEVFRREIRARTPVRAEEELKHKKFNRKTGKAEMRKPGYAKAHVGRWIKTESDGSLSAFVGYTPSAFYMKFREFGTKHQSAKPIVRPVFDSKSDEATKAFADELMNQIEAALK